MPKAMHDALIKAFSHKTASHPALKGKRLNNAVYGTMTNLLKDKVEGKEKGK